MFCAKCGRPVNEGQAFCMNCGAPAPKLPGGGTGGSADSEVTEVRPPDERITPGPVSPPPPPPQTPSMPQAPPPPPPSVSGQAPLNMPPKRDGRGGLIAGIAIAVIVVLAGGGTGAYLLLTGDGDGSNTTVVESSTSTEAATSSSASATTSTVLQDSTAQTVPDLSGSTGGPTTTGTSLDPAADYLAAVDDMVQVLLADDARIPELAAKINDSAPKVPRAVYDELQAMMGELDAVFTEFAYITVPAGFLDSDAWLQEAAMYMGNRIYATIQGIEAMWDTGSVSSATTYFEQGRQARDDFRAAFKDFQETVPAR